MPTWEQILRMGGDDEGVVGAGRSRHRNRQENETMSHIPANLGAATWAGPQPGSFRPSGRPEIIRRDGRGPLGDVEWTSTETHAARLFVGFSVGAEPTYDLDDLVELVRELRQAQTGDPAATFVAQRGVYRYKSGQVVEEQGGQVIIIDTEGLALTAFKAQIIALAEGICRRMEQELVVVEIQRNGVVLEVLGVAP